MTRGSLLIAALLLMSINIIWVIRISNLKEKIEVYEYSMEWQYETILLLDQKLAIERIKNTENDSILVVYKESMELHSSRLQDANWRLIQLKLLIEDDQKK